MAYLFENLGPEKFQQFCQALLLKDYPDLQCFPVGQPDGGRDALSRGSADAHASVIGQVKFKREDEAENAEWMIAALELELPKIELLAARGAKRYIMMTNARGTAHAEVGRIDRVQTWLDENSPIQAECLWRDDLERRLDSDAGSLKLTYPGMLSGEDTLTLIVEAQMGRERERISRVLRAFVSAQYLDDEEVKFRQVDLANSLLGLFVDVPSDISSVLWGSRKIDRQAKRALSRLIPAGRYEFSNFFDIAEESQYIGPRITAGTAELLLDADVQQEIPWVVLQGAPGQGKSTLAQYVCQVHRARYLDKVDFLSSISKSHAGSAFRLPIKVDLRDLANYLDGRPFLGLDVIHDQPRSLERFLSLLVQVKSGGRAFSADDFAETATRLPMLLFLDGLDEVADLDLRKHLVVKVLEALNRLKENDANLQVVVTSRPSLFSSAPSLRSFTTFSLAPIGNVTISAYADKWVTAKNLDPERAREVKGILAQKLDLGHIRELTRNPMQLTILLSLIHSVGYSLPDVRTDLYRQYVELFMTREAEKSPMVRDHRHLLLEIVEYLAWILQRGAESGSSGTVSRDELRLLIKERLEEAQQDPGILDDLFSGGLERVYVLVQRVEGLYEFEVQPLREYFAAKYLYASAPVSNFRHQEVFGDRAQRFEAMAVNPYWANVARFYAGFYEGGEIGALSTSLRELGSSGSFAAGLIARGLGAALLADWVFRSKRFIQNEVIELVFDNLGIELAATSNLAGFENAALPKACGRDSLAARIFNMYVEEEQGEPSKSILRLLRKNGGEGLADKFNEWALSSHGSERTMRVKAALVSGALNSAPGPTVENLFLSDSPSETELRNRVLAAFQHEPSIPERSEMLAKIMLRTLLDWGGSRASFLRNDLMCLSWMIEPELFKRAAIPDDGINPHEISVKMCNDGPALRDVVQRMSETLSPNRSSSIEDSTQIWTKRIEITREAYGDTWATYRLAVINVGLLSIAENVRADQGLLDDAAPLFTRALAGRAWRGRTSWWMEQISADDDNRAKLFWLAMLLSWAPSKYIQANITVILNYIDALSEEDYVRLLEVLNATANVRDLRGTRSRTGVVLGDDISDRSAKVLVAAIGDGQKQKMPEHLLGRIIDPGHSKKEDVKVRLSKFPGWKGLTTRQTNNWLRLFESLATLGGTIPPRAGFNLHRTVSDMGTKSAEKVLGAALAYPEEVVDSAYLSVQATYKPKHVGEIADDGHWTFE